MTANERLTAARGRVILRASFFGALLIRMPMIESRRVPTMSTNGQVILFNPDFVNSLSDVDLEAILLHEVMHAVLRHPLRRNDRGPGRWNSAADHATNLEMKAAGFYVPARGLADPDYAGMSAEEIYELLDEPEEKPKGGGGEDHDLEGEGGSNGQSSGGSDDDDPQVPEGDGDQPDAGAESEDDADGDEAEPEGDDGGDPGQMGGVFNPEQPIEAERELDQAIHQAAMMARMAGQSSLLIDRLVGEASEKHRDWRTALRDLAEPTHGQDYFWSKPNRRFISQGLHLPGTVAIAPPPLHVSIDASGSIDDDALEIFVGEIRSIQEEVRPERIDVTSFDTKAVKLGEFGPDEEIKVKVRGGGGTDFRCVTAYLEEDAVGLVILTDGYCDSYPEELDIPVIWVVWGPNKRFRPPWGEVVYLEN